MCISTLDPDEINLQTRNYQIFNTTVIQKTQKPPLIITSMINFVIDLLCFIELTNEIVST